MENQLVFGALAASAAAVNVALQFMSGATSLTGSVGGDGAPQTRVSKRKYEEDDDSYVPALIASMADDEAIARLEDYISETKTTTWWDEFQASDDPDPERWVSNFRVSQSTFDYICSLVKPDLESATPANFMSIEGRFIPVEKQVQCCCYYFSKSAKCSQPSIFKSLLVGYSNCKIN